MALVLMSCGAARRTERERVVDVQRDTLEKNDTFVPLHPPVVIPHPWNADK